METATLLAAASVLNLGVAVSRLSDEGVQQYLEDRKSKREREAKEREREAKKREREEYRKRTEENYYNHLIAQGEDELKKLNIEKFGFKLDEVALTHTDAFTYLIHDIKTDKKRWMMPRQIKEMIENSQRI